MKHLLVGLAVASINTVALCAGAQGQRPGPTDVDTNWWEVARTSNSTYYLQIATLKLSPDRKEISQVVSIYPARAGRIAMREVSVSKSDCAARRGSVRWSDPGSRQQLATTPFELGTDTVSASIAEALCQFGVITRPRR